MKIEKHLSFIVMLALASLTSLTSVFSQNDYVKNAERLAKGHDANYQEARNLIQQALKNPETANQVKTYYVAGFVEEENFTFENLKQVKNITPNKDVMNKALLDMYDYYNKAYTMDKQPNEKGKVKPHYVKKIIKAYKNNFDYFINAGGYYLEQKKFDLALKAFEDYRAIKRLPELADDPIAKVDSNSMMVDFFSVVAAYQANQKQLAVQMAEKIKNVPYRQNELYQILAQTQQELGDSTAYLTTLQEGLKLYPNEPYFSVNLINSYIQMGKTKEAIAALEGAIAQSPKNAQLYDVMGKLYENTDENKAIEFFSKAIEVNPDFIEAYYDLGRVYYNQAATLESGDNLTPEIEQKAKALLKKALPYLEKSYEKDPDKTHYVLKNIYLKLGMNDKVEAIRAIYGDN